MELDMYFDELMHVATSADLEIGTDTMHQCVASPAALKTMMRMLTTELDRGAKSMYSDATEARVRFQQDVTIEHTDTITDDQAWNRFAIVDHHKDVKELVLP